MDIKIVGSDDNVTTDNGVLYDFYNNNFGDFGNYFFGVTTSIANYITMTPKQHIDYCQQGDYYVITNSEYVDGVGHKFDLMGSCQITLNNDWTDGFNWLLDWDFFSSINKSIETLSTGLLVTTDNILNVFLPDVPVVVSFFLLSFVIGFLAKFLFGWIRG